MNEDHSIMEVLRMKTLLFKVLLKKRSWLIINGGSKSKTFDLHALIALCHGRLDSNIDRGNTTPFGFIFLFHAYEYDLPLTIVTNYIAACCCAVLFDHQLSYITLFSLHPKEGFMIQVKADIDFFLYNNRNNKKIVIINYNFI